MQSHQKSNISHLAKIYDHVVTSKIAMKEYFQDSGYINYGFWEKETFSQKDAGNNLVDKLISFLPEIKGKILDVANGAGGTTKRLMNYFNAKDIKAINITKSQIDQAKIKAPGCEIIQMSATEMEFERSSFNNIICVEAAFHFYPNRKKFLEEAKRVLTQDGNIILSDILYSCGKLSTLKQLFPTYNTVSNIDEYKQIFIDAGFNNIKVLDVTNQTWTRYKKERFISCVNTIKKHPWLFPFLICEYLSFIGRRSLGMTIKKYILVYAKKN